MYESPSCDTVSMRALSGLHEAELTVAACLRGTGCRALPTRKTRTAFCDIVANRLQSGLQMADKTASPWRSSLPSVAPSSVQTRAVLSFDAVMTRSPQGEKRAD